jgi:protein-S-isoprenylcysteine O-methyltransferase Ste14
MKGWDKVVSGLWAVVGIVQLVVAGLDERYGWSGPLMLSVHVMGIVIYVLGFALFSWAMITNAYFATVVRVQTEQGHRVCTTGPYRYVRHPGYVGAVLQAIGLPLVLGSLWAVLPGIISALLMVVRTALEDRTLRAELPGYVEYTQHTHYRLLPGIW